MVQQFTTVGEIRLSYYEQGDDLNNCYAYLDAEKKYLDFSTTLENHIAMLQSAIYQLSEINEIYKQMNPKNVRLEGESHYIGISGPTNFISKLIEEQLVEKNPFESEDESQELKKAYEYELQKDFQQMIKSSAIEDFEEGSEMETEYHVGSEIIHRACKTKMHTFLKVES